MIRVIGAVLALFLTAIPALAQQGQAVGPPVPAGLASVAGTLAIVSGKTATFNNTLTFSGTDGSSVAFGTGGTIAAVGYSGSASDLSAGTLLAGRMPALTGDCTTSVGAVALTCTKINGTAFPFTSAGTVTATDNSGASLVFTGVSINYSQSGNMVNVYGTLTYPSTASAAAASVTLTGAPLAANAQYAYTFCTFPSLTNLGGIVIAPNTRILLFYTTGSDAVATTNVQLSTAQIRFNCTYPAS